MDTCPPPSSSPTFLFASDRDTLTNKTPYMSKTKVRVSRPRAKDGVLSFIEELRHAILTIVWKCWGSTESVVLKAVQHLPTSTSLKRISPFSKPAPTAAILDENEAVVGPEEELTAEEKRWLHARYWEQQRM